MQQSIQKALKGKELIARQKGIIDGMKAKMVAVVDSMLDWDKLQPMYFRLYRQTFTQDDVDGMTAFYRTPPGQALFGVEIECCVRCGGGLKIIASIEEAQLIAKILSHLERAAPEHSQSELPFGARGPPTQSSLL